MSNPIDPEFNAGIRRQREIESETIQAAEDKNATDLAELQESLKKAATQLDIAKAVAEFAITRLKPNIALHHEVAIQGLKAWLKGSHTELSESVTPAWRLLEPTKANNALNRGENTSYDSFGLALTLKGALRTYRFHPRDMSPRHGVVVQELDAPEDFALRRNLTDNDGRYDYTDQARIKKAAETVRGCLQSFVVERLPDWPLDD